MAPVKKSKPTSWFSRLITFAGWAFAVLTVVINLADVTTDVIVAVQFHQGGHTVWFALVVTFLLVAHCVYTGVLAELIKDSPEWQRVLNYDRDVPRPLRWLFAVVFAQFVPLLNLIVVTIDQWRQESTTDAAPPPPAPPPPPQPLSRQGSEAEPLMPDWRSQPLQEETPELGALVQLDKPTSVVFSHEGSVTIDDFKFLPKATLQELEDIENSRELQERIKAAVEEHLKKFGLFYVESAVEAAPQAIIQLLAITFLGEASPVQLVSLCCSLFSITSKAFIISQAYDARVMIFKFALAAHDVFSMFYLFSTIVAVETHKDVSFFGLELSWVGYVWMWKMVVVAGLAFCTATGALCVIVYEERRNLDCREFCSFVGIYLLGLFVVGPVAIVYEAAKLSYANFGVTIVEPSGRSQWPAYTLLFNFLSNDDSRGPRLRHVLRGLQDAPAPPSFDDLSDMRISLAPENQPELIAAVDDDSKLVSLWNLPLLTMPKSARGGSIFGSRGPEVRTVLLLIWCALCLVVVVLGQLLSLAYPFVNAAFQFKTHNILQATCFYATCVALLIALITTPRALKYTLFNVGIKPYSHNITFELGQQLIGEYHLPPHISALQVYITAVPMEVAGVVGAYLNANDVGLGSLTIAQTTALKRQIKAVGASGFAIVDVVPQPPPKQRLGDEDWDVSQSSGDHLQNDDDEAATRLPDDGVRLVDCLATAPHPALRE